MIAQLYQPPFPLNQYVESYFYYTAFSPSHRLDRFLPDGNVQLIFDLTETTKYIYDNESLEALQSCSKVWFSGFRTKPITIPSGKGDEMMIVNFHKGKVLTFLTTPLFELTNRVVDAELVLPKHILEIRARLQDAPTVKAKFELLNRYFLSTYLQSAGLNPCVDFMVRTILKTPHHCSLNLIANRAGYSRRHLIQLFKSHVGVTPKDFLKIIRFQKAVTEIESRRTIYWTDVALDCGFYDQSHFIADFKKFSGLTPTAYLRRKGGLLNYVPVT